MPYRRRTYRKRSYRRSYPRTGYGLADYAKMAKQAYNGVKYLKSLVNVEKHPLDINTSINPDTTGLMTLLNATVQGDAEANRAGNSILLRSVNINMKFTMNTSATNTTIRYILFFDKEANGATPTGANILQNVSPIGNYDHNQASRFEVLYDNRLTLSVNGTSEVVKRIYRRLQRHTHYDGVAGTAADIVDYGLWLYMVSDEGTNTPTVQIRSQLLFIDN